MIFSEPFIPNIIMQELFFEINALEVISQILIDCEDDPCAEQEMYFDKEVWLDDFYYEEEN